MSDKIDSKRRGMLEIREATALGDRIVDKTTMPSETLLSSWLGLEAYENWVQFRRWIDINYSGVFEPDWIHGGRKRGWALRFKKNKAFCMLIPGYQIMSVQVVLGRSERNNFEERRYFWSPKLVKLYDETHSYPDGKWLTIPVVSVEQRQEIMDLLVLKRSLVLSR